jgi:hypothetical protein
MIFFQLYDQVLHRSKVDAQTGMACLHGKRYGQMSLEKHLTYEPVTGTIAPENGAIQYG